MGNDGECGETIQNSGHLYHKGLIKELSVIIWTDKFRHSLKGPVCHPQEFRPSFCSFQEVIFHMLEVLHNQTIFLGKMNMVDGLEARETTARVP